MVWHGEGQVQCSKGGQVEGRRPGQVRQLTCLCTCMSELLIVSWLTALLTQLSQCAKLLLSQVTAAVTGKGP